MHPKDQTSVLESWPFELSLIELSVRISGLWYKSVPTSSTLVYPFELLHAIPKSPIYTV